MKTLNINEIVEAAKAIANKKDVNLFLAVRGNIIEGCRNRKTSEVFEFDVKREVAKYDSTRNEIATTIIYEAIDSLKGDDKIVVEFEEYEEMEEVKEVEEVKESPVVEMRISFDPSREYFLRFTNDEKGDLERGTSLFKTPTMDAPKVLNGLCGFNVDLVGLSIKEIERKISKYVEMFPQYSTGSKAVIFEGKYVKNNSNSEGVIFKPFSIVGYVKY